MDIPASAVKKIAVLRANAVGDFIVSLPALDALRHAYPGAQIVLLGRQWHVSFLANRPGPVDRTVVVPRIPGICDPCESQQADRKELARFFEQMREERFDLAFQLHGGGRYSNPFIGSIGAKITIGARTPDASTLDRWVPYRLYQNETVRLLEIVSLAGARPIELEPRLNITDEDLAEARHVVPEDGRPIAVINPGCRDPRRRWPSHKFAAVADTLARRGARIIINGDGGDLPAVQQTLYWTHSLAESVCGTLSLRGLAGLLSRARLLVSNDSGPVHLASALGTRTVAIYWCGNVHTYAPIGSRTTAVHIAWRLHCPACGMHCMNGGCKHEDSFVSDISAPEVIDSALELYEQEPVQKW